MKINGKEVDVASLFEDQRIYLPKESVIKGINTVEIVFVNEYRNTGTGLHRFVDPADKGEYLYTQFEPFHAHRAIPCFDQPDIKGTMILSTVVPTDHVSLSNMHETSEFTNEESKDESRHFMKQYEFEHLIDELGSYKITKFGKTPKISSYLYAIIAGPYDIVEKYAEIPGKTEPIRMRFMARKSICKSTSVAYEDMYDAVVTGIKWYSEFYGRNFPWSKYDQIFCPEFKYGAMENVGAVTFSENYIPTDSFTEIHLTRLQNTTLHELCHQWFGNLCTMTWWNDLWLNEAFATYMAFLCTDESEHLRKKTPGLWISLNARKTAANNSDTLSTTHPIIKEAENTNSADDMVNAITYGKGSSFIKQLIHMIGREAMSESCKIYFKKHEWGNTVLSDFLSALEEGCKSANVELEVDLKQYCTEFLTTKGVNILSAQIEEAKGGIKITINQQQGRNSNSLLIQKVNFTLYDKNMTPEEHTIILDKSGTQTIEILGRTVDDTFILLNSSDEGYCQIRMNDNIIKILKEGGLSKIKESINRTLIWRSLISMVKDLKIKSTEFIEIAIANIFQETDIILLNTFLPTFKSFISLYIPNDKYNELCDQMFEKAYETLSALPSDQKDLAGVFKSNILYFIESQDNLEKALDWLENNCIILKDGTKNEDLSLKKTEINFIIKKIYQSSKFDTEFKDKLFEKHVGTEQSDRNVRLKISCQTAIPDRENKAKAWDIITNPKDNNLSIYDYNAYLSGFYCRSQIMLGSEYIEKYVEELPKFARTGEKDHMSTFSAGACPPSYLTTKELLDGMAKVVEELANEDKDKYESFLRIVQTQIESKRSQISIRDYAMS